MVLIELGHDLQVGDDLEAKLQKDLNLLEKRIPQNSDVRITLGQKKGQFIAHISGKVFFHRVSIRRSGATIKEAYVKGRGCLIKQIQKLHSRIKTQRHRVAAS